MSCSMKIEYSSINSNMLILVEGLHLDSIIRQYQPEECEKQVVTQSKQALDEGRDFADYHGILIDQVAMGFSLPHPEFP